MKKIALISTNALGDTYMSLSAVQPLRSYFGNECEIYLIADSNCREMAFIAGVDEVIAIDRKNIFTTLLSFIKLFRKQFDFVFSFFPGRINSIISLIVRKKCFSGFRNYALKENWWINSREKGIVTGSIRRTFEWNSSEPYLQRIKKSLESADISCSEISKPILINKEKKNDNHERYILIHYHSKQKERSLNSHAVCSIIEYLHKQLSFNIRIVYWGEIEQSELNMFKIYSYVSLIQNSKLLTTISLIVNAELFLCVESFPMHLADAHNANFLGIFGSSNPQTALQHPENSIIMHNDNLYEIKGEEIINFLINKIA